MYVIEMSLYTLILSYNPCDVFTHYNVTEMHGLNAFDCQAHENNESQAYIAGWCNYAPKESGEYVDGDRVFVFINLSRCTDDVRTMGVVMHEMMHCSGHVFGDRWNEKEEEMITWAEEEAYKVVDIIKGYEGL